MTTSKLFVLGSALLLAAAGLAQAEDAVPGDAAPPSAEAAELPAVPSEDAASAELPVPEEDLAAAEQPAPAMPEAAAAEQPTPAAPEAAAVAEQPMPAASEEPAAAAAAAPEPALPGAGELAEAQPEAAEPVEEMPPAAEAAQAPSGEGETLGMVGYDEQGRQGRIHLVVPGDTLWDISAAYLGTPWVWPSIWQDNRNIANPNLIFPGDRIWITPWEMRKVSAEEAASLLAGSPAAPEPVVVSEEEPEPAAVVPEIGVVREEQTTVVVSDRELVGLVTAEAVEASASIVSTVAQDRVMLGQGDRVWVGLGEDDVEPGDQFTIFRVQEKVYDPETGRMLGYHVNILGWLDVTAVHPETSSALIRESALDIEVGDRIMPRTPPVEEVAVQPSPGDVDGQISFLAQQRTLMGTMEYVYLNRGTLDGIEVGSPLQVYRPGFMAREQVRGENVEVPDRVIADLLVVKAEPEVSVALIRHTEEELALGDRFRGARN